MAGEEEIEEQEETQDTEVQPDVEAKARDMGWVPKDQFRGDPDNWKPADEYVKRGEEFLPFIKKDRDKFKERADQLAGELASVKKEHETKFERLERMNQIALDQQRELLTREFSAKKRAAVKDGDEETYERLETEERQALTDLDKKVAPPKEEKKKDAAPELPAAVKDTVDSWLADNRWFQSDKEMNAVASAHHEKLLEDKPGLSLAENLQEVREYVKKRYPEKFGNGEDRRGSPVEGGSRGGGGGSKSLWAKVPPEAKAIADRQIKEGLFKFDSDGKEIADIGKRRERYAQMYFQDEAQ